MKTRLLFNLCLAVTFLNLQTAFAQIIKVPFTSINTDKSSLSFTSSRYKSSSEQSVVITGIQLQNGIHISSDNNFQFKVVTIDDSAVEDAQYVSEYSNSITGDHTATIEVRMLATYNGSITGSLVITDAVNSDTRIEAGSVSAIVNLSGTVTSSENIYFGDAPAAFTSTVDYPSNIQSVMLVGNGTNSSTTITAPANFEIALGAGNNEVARTTEPATFSSSVTISYNYFSYEILVRYRPTSTGTHSGNLTASSTVNNDIKRVSDAPVTATIPLSGSTTTTAVDDIRFQNGAAIYPNPANDVLNVPANNSIQIYDVQGLMVAESANKTQINVSELKAGIYTVKLTDGSKVKASKFIKQ